MSCSRLCDLQNLIIQLTDMYTMVVKGRRHSKVVKYEQEDMFAFLPSQVTDIKVKYQVLRAAYMLR